MTEEGNDDLKSRVNAAVREWLADNDTHFQALDDETIISYCIQVVKQRVKFRERNKSLRKQIKELEAALSDSGEVPALELPRRRVR